jgi:predicted DNA-binding transcriptional regulator AlpA
MNTLLTQREAASVLRCSERTLERLRLIGNGPRYIKATRRVLYRESDLEAWVASRVVGSTSETIEIQSGESHARS